jgi:NADH:ubiquinone oxidoreductase subunit 5 (chain L)/Multisubunit Na+/H+ antiporter, MnhA subunit
MNGLMLLFPIILPLAAAILILILSKNKIISKEILSFLAFFVNLILSISMFGKSINFDAPWCGFGINMSLKLYRFSGFILLSVSIFAFLAVVYSIIFMKNRDYSRLFYVYLLVTLSFVNGAVLANNLIVMLFFWEGLLIPLFGIILTGGRKAFPTAVKALVLSGTADLCMMIGIGMTVYLSNGVYTIDRINLPMDFMGSMAFIFLMIGATAKAGSMPFHSWIPDAASDTPLPFMAFLPGSLEKLLGIYFLVRISLDMFQFKSGTPVSTIMMIIGAATIIFAVMMALVQHDYKRLLAYHSISQVGYMVLGIGTAVPVGIVGGLFHMINNAIYKNCLFLTAGSVERQTGTTNLEKLGGLGRKMPVTSACFLIAAASISGVPPFNGFFSKELIFEGALESGFIFYIAALVGAFFTAASFLKLGHAVYFGKQQGNSEKAEEAPWPMLLPMIVLSFGCILFGIINPLPLKYLIEPVLGSRLTHTTSGFPQNWLMAGVSLVVLGLAYLDHMYGFKKTGSGLESVDHIHYAPGLSVVYKWAELKYFDLYEIGRKFINIMAKLAFKIDRAVDWILSVFLVKFVRRLSRDIKEAHTGDQSMYIGWSIAGVFIMIIIAVYLSTL